MKPKDVSCISSITTQVCDASLMQDIVDIERQVQPQDNWNKKAITDLLSQDIYQCWAVTNAPLTIAIESNDLEQYDTKSTHIADRNVIAYCIFSQVFEVAEILRIGTHPDYQRQGYAQQLLKSIIEHMLSNGINKILLEVRADNTSAIKLYQKIGFKVMDTRKGYYSFVNQSGANCCCDALIMACTL